MSEISVLINKAALNRDLKAAATRIQTIDLLKLAADDGVDITRPEKAVWFLLENGFTDEAHWVSRRDPKQYSKLLEHV